jgi:hypothetical protein
MPLRETLQTILTDYTKAKSEPLEGHALAQFIRGDAEDAVQQALGELGTGLWSRAAQGRAIGQPCRGFRCLTQRSPPAPPAAITLSICSIPMSRWCMLQDLSVGIWGADGSTIARVSLSNPELT